MSPGARTAIRAVADYGAAITFVATLLITHDFQRATWVLVAASVIALAVGWISERRLAPLPLFAGAFALVFGLLTLVFHDPRFVKMKPTFEDSAFACALFAGLALGKNPLKSLLGQALTLPDEAWRTLTVRYGIFFIACAAANEFVWRAEPARLAWPMLQGAFHGLKATPPSGDSVWGLFRLGMMGAAAVFSIFQVPYLLKHMPDPDKQSPIPPSPDPGF